MENKEGMEMTTETLDNNVGVYVQETLASIQGVFGEDSNAAKAAEQVKESYEQNMNAGNQTLDQVNQELRSQIEELRMQNQQMQQSIEDMYSHSVRGMAEKAKESVKSWFENVKESVTEWVDNQKELVGQAREAKAQEKAILALQSEQISRITAVEQKELNLERLQEQEQTLENKIALLGEKLRAEQEKIQERNTAIEAVKNLFRKKEEKKDLAKVATMEAQSKQIDKLKDKIEDLTKEAMSIRLEQESVKKDIFGLQIDIDKFNQKYPDLFDTINMEDDLQKNVREAMKDVGERTNNRDFGDIEQDFDGR